MRAFVAVCLMLAVPSVAFSWPWSTDMANQPSIKPQEGVMYTYPKRSVPACPDGVNPMLMLRVARMKAIGALGDAPQLKRGRDKAYFRRVHAFSALQLEDEEIASWQR